MTAAGAGKPLRPVAARAIGAAVALVTDIVSPALGTPAALAVPLCDPPPVVRVLRTGLGVLESAIVDKRGRLFFTSQTWDGLVGALLRMDHPDAEPDMVADGILSPGGLAFDDRGTLIVGFGDSLWGGLVGNVAGLAGLLLVDPETGSRETRITGLAMANGIACATDGSILASNDFGTHIDCVTHGNVYLAAGLESRPPTASRSTQAAAIYTQHRHSPPQRSNASRSTAPATSRHTPSPPGSRAPPRSTASQSIAPGACT